MRLPIPQVEPVAIALDQIDTTGDVRFTGVDLETGARVTVMIERTPKDRTASGAASAKRSATGLVLVLTVETIAGRQ